MSARPHREDRGLAAVRRVREVRETDSRIGLKLALDEEGAAGDRHAGFVGRLAATELPDCTTPGELMALHRGLVVLGDALVAARSESAQATALAADARSRWAADRARLAAVELLLTRRADRRRAEAQRRESAEADDLAGQRWLRSGGAGR